MHVISCYVGNPRESFFRVRESNIFFRESFAKVGYYNHYVKGCHPLPPGVRQEKGTREFRFGSGSVPCVVVLVDNHTLHRSQPSFQRRGFATAKCDGPEAYPCTCRCHCLMMLFEVVKKQSPNAVAKFPKVKLWESQTPVPLVFTFLIFSFNAHPADGRGL